MSEEKNSPLGSLLQNVRQGVSNMVGKENRHEPVINEDPAEPKEPTVDTDNSTAANQRDVETDFDSMLQEDTEQTQNQQLSLRDRLAALSGKQKALLGAVVIVGVLAAKNQLDSPEAPAQEPAAVQEQNAGEVELQNDQAAVLEGEFKSNSGVESLGEGGSSEADPVNLAPLELDLNEVVGDTGNAAISTEKDLNPLDTFTPDEATDSTESPIAELPAAVPTPVDTPAPATEQATAESVQPAQTPQENVSADKPTAANDTPASPSPFEADQGGAFGEAILAGEEKQGVDSSSPAPLGQTEISADAKKLAELEALVKEQAASIEKLKTDLANAKKSAAPQQVTKPKVHAPQKPLIVQSSKPKQAPRPRVCVKAVAQAARNCSTCVAHAFVVSNGTETMVGHGDKLDGYRVSIVGDRLDLQGAEGTEPHKFWSSPKGCSY